jgi:hypothetical protein
VPRRACSTIRVLITSVLRVGSSWVQSIRAIGHHVETGGFPRVFDRVAVRVTTSCTAQAIILGRSSGSSSGVQRRASPGRNSRGRTVDTAFRWRDGCSDAADRVSPAAHHQPDRSASRRNQSTPYSPRILHGFSER